MDEIKLQLDALQTQIEACLSAEAELNDDAELADLLVQRNALLRQLADVEGMRDPAYQPFWQQQLELTQGWQERALVLKQQAQELLIKQRQGDSRLQAYRQNVK